MSDNNLTITQISGNIWQFNESTGGRPYVDAYLIVGSERALVIDALMNEAGLYGEVRKLTGLPLDLVITHAHPDHAGASVRPFYEAGCKIYMDQNDIDGLGDMPLPVEAEWFTPCPEGTVFDLGDRKLEVILIPGHTPGCIVLLDRENQLLFSGDSIGSGHFWMQVPAALPLGSFARNLEKLYNETKKYPGLLVYPGHRNQSPVQLTGQYVKDTLTITKRLISGVWEGKDAELNFNGMVMKYKEIGYGQMVSFCYDPAKLRFAAPDPKNEAIKDKFTQGQLVDGGNRFGYMLFSPEIKEGEKYPLVIYLHGGGECGDEPRLALANSGATAFAHPDWQKEHPCFVLAPQCPKGLLWSTDSNAKLLAKAAQTLPMTYPIDSNRIYITGLSLGGMGTWNMISKYPNLFAAAMPICGAGNPSDVKNAKNVPVWAFHAADDPVVPVDEKLPNPRLDNFYGTRRLVAALRSTGNPNVRYTEYAPGYMENECKLFAHASWVPAYANKEALEWMFSQSRFDKYEIERIMPGVWFIDDFRDSSFYVIEGADRALVIDTGMGGGDVVALVKSLTKLPFELAATHAHGDHIAHADKFGAFYMSKKDLPVVEGALKRMGIEKAADKYDIKDIKDGDKIDLGGGVVIEVMELAGHTPGSVAFLDAYHGLCFTGDAVGSGSGVWMQVPGALNLSEYKANLESFSARIRARNIENLWFLGGHRWQELGYPAGSQYNPITLNLIDDMAELCGMVLSDDVDFDTYPMSMTGEKTLVAEYKTAKMLFRESNRK